MNRGQCNIIYESFKGILEKNKKCFRTIVLIFLKLF